jgi:RNA 3'-terminal phosphate cyclase
MLRPMGVDAELELHRAGWYPAGQGEVAVWIHGGMVALRPIISSARGKLLCV